MKCNEATGVTCSCGIGPNKMLSKLATEINKPNGQYLMKNDKEEIMSFLSKLPVRKIPFIGSQSEQLLNGLGINTCSDILTRASEIYIAFTENAFDFFIRSALGVARCYHETLEDRKSVNVSRTFPVITKVEEFEKKIREIAGLISEDLKQYKKKSKHITLVVKTHNFDVKNHGTPTDKYMNDADEIANVCLKMLKHLLPLDPLRLIGIKAAQLINESELNKLQGFFLKNPAKNSSASKLDKISPLSIESKSTKDMIAMSLKKSETSSSSTKGFGKGVADSKDGE